MSKHAKGLFRDKKKHEIFKATQKKHYKDVLVVLPSKTAFRGLIAPPENQQNCGACWDFSITNTLRSQVILTNKKDPGALSKNSLLCNCFPNGVNLFGCGGGDFDAGLNYLNGQGPCLEYEWPYQGGDDHQVCKIGMKVAATAAKWVLVGDGKNKPTAHDLCEAIWNNGEGRCLSVDVAADDTWSDYASGIYDKNTSQEIDHMVRIVDYDAETSIDSKGNAVFDEKGNFINGDGFFYVRNNWDTTWGENGDMRSRYGANNLAETAMFFVINNQYPQPIEENSDFTIWQSALILFWIVTIAIIGILLRHKVVL